MAEVTPEQPGEIIDTVLRGRSSRRGNLAPASLSEAAAHALVAGHLEAMLANRDAIVALDTGEIRRMAELATATRAGCGGNACG